MIQIIYLHASELWNIFAKFLTFWKFDKIAKTIANDQPIFNPNLNQIEISNQAGYLYGKCYFLYKLT